MAKKKKTHRNAAGRSKRPAASSTKIARRAEKTVAKRLAGRRFEKAKEIARADRLSKPKKPRGPGRGVRPEEFIEHHRAKAAKRAAKKSTTKARPSSTEVPLGKGKLSYIRFDTPKSKLIHAAVEKYARNQHAGVPMKTVLFNLMKIGLEVLTAKNLFKPDVGEKDVDLRPFIDAWAAHKWPEPEERPTLKGSIFLVLAKGLEAAAHVTAAALSTVGTRPPSRPKKPSAADPTKRTKSGNPKRAAAKKAKPLARSVKPTKKGGGPRVVKEGDQGEPIDDVPAINRNEQNDDAERQPDEE